MCLISVDALTNRGSGLSSVRFICGTQDIHKKLEQTIAQFHQREDAIIYASCFDANAGIFETLLGPEDAVISDQLNHASIIDGIRLEVFWLAFLVGWGVCFTLFKTAVKNLF